METIYVVYEIGEGSIHLAFKNKLSAEEYIQRLKEETQLDCYVILTLRLVEN